MILWPEWLDHGTWEWSPVCIYDFSMASKTEEIESPRLAKQINGYKWIICFPKSICLVSIKHSFFQALLVTLPAPSRCFFHRGTARCPPWSRCSLQRCRAQDGPRPRARPFPAGRSTAWRQLLVGEPRDNNKKTKNNVAVWRKTTVCCLGVEFFEAAHFLWLMHFVRFLRKHTWHIKWLFGWIAIKLCRKTGTHFQPDHRFHLGILGKIFLVGIVAGQIAWTVRCGCHSVGALSRPVTIFHMSPDTHSFSSTLTCQWKRQTSTQFKWICFTFHSSKEGFAKNF